MIGQLLKCEQFRRNINGLAMFNETTRRTGNSDVSLNKMKFQLFSGTDDNKEQLTKRNSSRFA